MFFFFWGAPQDLWGESQDLWGGPQDLWGESHDLWGESHNLWGESQNLWGIFFKFKKETQGWSKDSCFLIDVKRNLWDKTGW